jgi:hypothetical protein
VPGELTVTVLARRHGATAVAIWASAVEADGRPVDGQASGAVGGTPLPAHRTAGGVPAVWVMTAAPGVAITVTVTADDGRAGSGETIAP